MLKFLVVFLIVLFNGCSSINDSNSFLSIEDECKLTGEKNSEQCKILYQNDWSQSEKEHQMGFIYFFSIDGIPRDCKKAKYWFEKAANKKNAKSYDGLAALYSIGCGVNKNFVKAKEYNLIANKTGSINAKANIGDLYREGGYGLEKDLDKALNWYLMSIQDTPARAYYGLASINIEMKDYEKAYKYYKISANMDYTESQYNLGYMYDEGIYIEQDKDIAKYWYEKAANKGHTFAQHNLKILLEEVK